MVALLRILCYIYSEKEFYITFWGRPAHCHIMESDFLEMVVVHAACKNEYEKSKYFNILNILEIHCCS